MLSRKIQNILSGDKDFTNKTILNTNTLGFERAFLLIHICRCLYFITFYLKNRHFCPPKCPRDKKGTKKYVPRVPGAQTRDKIDFYSIWLLFNVLADDLCLKLSICIIFANRLIINMLTKPIFRCRICRIRCLKFLRW